MWLFKREAKDRMIVKVDDAGIMPAEDLEKGEAGAFSIMYL